MGPTTLDVLDEGQFELLPVGELPDHRRDSLEASQSGRLDAAFPCNNAVAVERLGHQDGLQDPVIGDARCQRFKVRMGHVTARLVRVDVDLVEWDLVRAGQGPLARWNERRKPAPKGGPRPSGTHWTPAGWVAGALVGSGGVPAPLLVITGIGSRAGFESGVAAGSTAHSRARNSRENAP